jgi:hypothetical protein
MFLPLRLGIKYSFHPMEMNFFIFLCCALKFDTHMLDNNFIYIILHCFFGHGVQMRLRRSSLPLLTQRRADFIFFWRPDRSCCSHQVCRSGPPTSPRQIKGL